MSGGSFPKRSRKLFVVEEFSKRDIGFTLVFRLKALVKFAQFTIVGISLQLLIPFSVALGIKPALQLHKLSRGEFGNRRFNFHNGTHGKSITQLTRPRQAGFSEPNGAGRKVEKPLQILWGTL